MSIEADAIAQIDATLLPSRERHHLRLLAHCLDSFRAMESDGTGQLPGAASRRRWCEQQPVVAEDPGFMQSLLLQLDQAARQLQDLADALGRPALALTLEDLIAAAKARTGPEDPPAAIISKPQR